MIRPGNTDDLVSKHLPVGGGENVIQTTAKRGERGLLLFSLLKSAISEQWRHRNGRGVEVAKQEEGRLLSLFRPLMQQLQLTMADAR
jgi:hypothetical protein